MAEAKAHIEGAREGYVVRDATDAKSDSFSRAAARQAFNRTNW